MKKAEIIVLMTAIILQAFSQEVDSKEKERKTKTTPNFEKTHVTIGDTLLSIEDDKGSFRIRIGKRGLEILDSLEGKPKISLGEHNSKTEIEDINRYSHGYSDRDERRKRHFGRFKGHWSGIEIGFNNLLTDNNSFVMPADIDYMTLHSGKSTCFNLNFAQQSFGFKRNFGLVTGLGLNWNNYRFDGNNNIQKGNDGIIFKLDPEGILKKSKFTTVYLTLPLLLEIQIPTDSKQINLSGGFIGAIKLGSHNKMVFQNGDKVKSDDDFSLNLLRYGPTLRIGFENLNLYATYYKTPLFRSGKGPGGYALHPFEIGFSFTFND